MTRLASIATMFALAIAVTGQVFSQPTNGQQYTNSQIKQMISDAHTSRQYRDIASYFRARQQSFEQQAQSEKAEWERRSQNVTGPAAKYPRPVDSSKNRYDYFTYEAQQMALQADRFENLAAKVQ